VTLESSLGPVAITTTIYISTYVIAYYKLQKFFKKQLCVFFTPSHYFEDKNIKIQLPINSLQNILHYMSKCELYQLNLKEYLTKRNFVVVF